MKSVGRADASDVGRGEWFARPHGLHHVERPLELQAVLFFGCECIIDLPHGQKGPFSLNNEAFEFVGFQRKGRINAPVGPAEGDVFFEDNRAEGHCRYCRTNAHRVIGETHRYVEKFAQVRNRVQVGAFGRSRVGTRAFEQHKVAAPVGPEDFYRLVEVGNGGHASTHYDGFTRLSHPFKQNMIGILKRCDLVQRHIKRFQKIDRCGVKGR